MSKRHLNETTLRRRLLLRRSILLRAPVVVTVVVVRSQSKGPSHAIWKILQRTAMAARTILLVQTGSSSSLVVEECVVGSEEQRIVLILPTHHRPGRPYVLCSNDGHHTTSEHGRYGSFGRISRRSMVHRHGHRQRRRRCFGTSRSLFRTTDPPSPGCRRIIHPEEVVSLTFCNCVRCRNTRRSKRQKSNAKVVLFSFLTTVKIWDMILTRKTLHVDVTCQRKRPFPARDRRHSRKELTIVAFLLLITSCRRLRVHPRSNHFWTRKMTKCPPLSYKSSSTGRQRSFFILILRL
mmetsp:Transcript_56590/g.137435  ORF Transcript_56590/g.137435 Transcript_56590/m.137435 type:complete len:293 (-) Transcript_56590:2633-3511(-)